MRLPRRRQPLRQAADRVAGPVAGRTLPADVEKDSPWIEVDARIVAGGLGIEPHEVEPGRQEGTISTLCERGTGVDAGLMRVTFYRGARRLRLVLGADGAVLQQEPAPDQANT